MLQYALLHLYGYALSLDDIKAFRVSSSIFRRLRPFLFRALDVLYPCHPKTDATGVTD